MFRGNKKDPDPQKSTPLHKPQDETQPTVEGNGQYETNVRRTMNKPQDETQPTVEGNGQYETNVRRTMNKPQDETQPTVEGNGQYETNVRRTMNKRMLSPDWEEGQNRPREAWLGAGTSEGVGIIPCRRSGEEGSDVDGNGPTLRSTKRFAAEDKSNRDAESGSPSVMRKAAPSLMTRGPKKTTRERVEARTQDLDFGVIDPRPDIFGTATCGAGLNLDRRRSSDRSSVDSAHYIRVPKGQEVGVSSAGSHYIHAGGEEDVVEKCHVSLESEPTAVDSRVDAFPYASSAKHVQGYRIPAAHSHQRNRSSRSEAGLLRARTPSYCSSVDRNKDSEGEIYHDVPETLSDGSNSETPTDGRNYEADFDIQQRNQQSAKLKKKERNLDDMEKGIGHRIKETHERGTRNCPEDMDGSTEARSDLNSISRREENEDNRPQRRRYSGRQTIRQVHNDPYLKLEAEYFNENQAVLDSLRLEGQWKPDSDLLPTLARHNAQENLEDLTFQEKAGIPECEHEIQYDFENLQHMLQRQPPPLPGFYSGHFEDKDLREDFCSEEPQSPEIEQRAVALQCPNLEPEQWLYYQEDAHSEHKHERQAPLATGPKSSRESSTNPPQRPSLRGEEGLQFQLDPDQIHHHHHHNQGQPQIPHTPTNKTRPLTQPSLITTTRVKPVQPSLITTTRVKLNLSRPKRPSSLPLKFVCQPLEARGLGQHPQPQKPSQDGSGGRPPPTGGDPSSAREKRSRRRQQENHLLLMERGDIHNLHLLEDLKERESSGGGRQQRAIMKPAYIDEEDSTLGRETTACWCHAVLIALRSLLHNLTSGDKKKALAAASSLEAIRDEASSDVVFGTLRQMMDTGVLDSAVRVLVSSGQPHCVRTGTEILRWAVMARIRLNNYNAWPSLPDLMDQVCDVMNDRHQAPAVVSRVRELVASTFCAILESPFGYGRALLSRQTMLEKHVLAQAWVALFDLCPVCHVAAWRRLCRLVYILGRENNGMFPELGRKGEEVAVSWALYHCGWGVGGVEKLLPVVRILSLIIKKDHLVDLLIQRKTLTLTIFLHLFLHPSRLFSSLQPGHPWWYDVGTPSSDVEKVRVCALRALASLCQRERDFLVNPLRRSGVISLRRLFKGLCCFVLDRSVKLCDKMDAAFVMKHFLRNPVAGKRLVQENFSTLFNVATTYTNTNLGTALLALLLEAKELMTDKQSYGTKRLLGKLLEYSGNGAMAMNIAANMLIDGSLRITDGVTVEVTKLAWANLEDRAFRSIFDRRWLIGALKVVNAVLTLRATTLRRYQHVYFERYFAVEERWKFERFVHLGQTDYGYPELQKKIGAILYWILKDYRLEWWTDLNKRPLADMLTKFVTGGDSQLRLVGLALIYLLLIKWASSNLVNELALANVLQPERTYQASDSSLHGSFKAAIVRYVPYCLRLSAPFAPDTSPFRHFEEQVREKHVDIDIRRTVNNSSDLSVSARETIETREEAARVAVTNLITSLQMGDSLRKTIRATRVVRCEKEPEVTSVDEVVDAGRRRLRDYTYLDFGFRVICKSCLLEEAEKHAMPYLTDRVSLHSFVWSLTMNFKWPRLRVCYNEAFKRLCDFIKKRLRDKNGGGEVSKNSSGGYLADHEGSSHNSNPSGGVQGSIFPAAAQKEWLGDINANTENESLDQVQEREQERLCEDEAVREEGGGGGKPNSKQNLQRTVSESSQSDVLPVSVCSKTKSKGEADDGQKIFISDSFRDCDKENSSSTQQVVELSEERAQKPDRSLLEQGHMTDDSDSGDDGGSNKENIPPGHLVDIKRGHGEDSHKENVSYGHSLKTCYEDSDGGNKENALPRQSPITYQPASSPSQSSPYPKPVLQEVNLTGLLHTGNEDNDNEDLSLCSVNEELGSVKGEFGSVSEELGLCSVNEELGSVKEEFGSVSKELSLWSVNKELGLVQEKFGSVSEELGLCSVNEELVSVNEELGLCSVNEELSLGSVNEELGVCSVNEELGSVNEELGQCSVNAELSLYSVNEELSLRSAAQHTTSQGAASQPMDTEQPSSTRGQGDSQGSGGPSRPSDSADSDRSARGGQSSLSQRPSASGPLSPGPEQDSVKVDQAEVESHQQFCTDGNDTSIETDEEFFDNDVSAPREFQDNDVAEEGRAVGEKKQGQKYNLLYESIVAHDGSVSTSSSSGQTPDQSMATASEGPITQSDSLMDLSDHTSDDEVFVYSSNPQKFAAVGELYQHQPEVHGGGDVLEDPTRGRHWTVPIRATELAHYYYRRRATAVDVATLSSHSTGRGDAEEEDAPSDESVDSITDESEFSKKRRQDRLNSNHASALPAQTKSDKAGLVSGKHELSSPSKASLSEAVSASEMLPSFKGDFDDSVQTEFFSLSDDKHTESNSSSKEVINPLYQTETSHKDEPETRRTHCVADKKNYVGADGVESRLPDEDAPVFQESAASFSHVTKNTHGTDGTANTDYKHQTTAKDQQEKKRAHVPQGKKQIITEAIHSTITDFFQQADSNDESEEGSVHCKEHSQESSPMLDVLQSRGDEDHQPSVGRFVFSFPAEAATLFERSRGDNTTSKEPDVTEDAYSCGVLSPEKMASENERYINAPRSDSRPAKVPCSSINLGPMHKALSTHKTEANAGEVNREDVLALSLEMLSEQLLNELLSPVLQTEFPNSNESFDDEESSPKSVTVVVELDDDILGDIIRAVDRQDLEEEDGGENIYLPNREENLPPSYDGTRQDIPYLAHFREQIVQKPEELCSEFSFLSERFVDGVERRGVQLHNAGQDVFKRASRCVTQSNEKRNHSPEKLMSTNSQPQESESSVTSFYARGKRPSVLERLRGEHHTEHRIATQTDDDKDASSIVDKNAGKGVAPNRKEQKSGSVEQQKQNKKNSSNAIERKPWQGSSSQNMKNTMTDYETDDSKDSVAAKSDTTESVFKHPQTPRIPRRRCKSSGSLQKKKKLRRGQRSSSCLRRGDNRGLSTKSLIGSSSSSLSSELSSNVDLTSISVEGKYVKKRSFVSATSKLLWRSENIERKLPKLQNGSSRHAEEIQHDDAGVESSVHAKAVRTCDPLQSYGNHSEREDITLKDQIVSDEISHPAAKYRTQEDTQKEKRLEISVRRDQDGQNVSQSEGRQLKGEIPKCEANKLDESSFSVSKFQIRHEDKLQETSLSQYLTKKGDTALDESSLSLSKYLIRDDAPRERRLSQKRKMFWDLTDPPKGWQKVVGRYPKQTGESPHSSHLPGRTENNTISENVKDDGQLMGACGVSMYSAVEHEQNKSQVYEHILEVFNFNEAGVTSGVVSSEWKPTKKKQQHVKMIDDIPSAEDMTHVLASHMTQYGGSVPRSEMYEATIEVTQHAQGAMPTIQCNSPRGQVRSLRLSSREERLNRDVTVKRKREPSTETNSEGLSSDKLCSSDCQSVDDQAPPSTVSSKGTRGQNPQRKDRTVVLPSRNGDHPDDVTPSSLTMNQTQSSSSKNPRRKPKVTVKRDFESGEEIKYYSPASKIPKKKSIFLLQKKKKAPKGKKYVTSDASSVASTTGDESRAEDAKKPKSSRSSLQRIRHAFKQERKKKLETVVHKEGVSNQQGQTAGADKGERAETGAEASGPESCAASEDHVKQDQKADSSRSAWKQKLIDCMRSDERKRSEQELPFLVLPTEEKFTSSGNTMETPQQVSMIPEQRSEKQDTDQTQNDFSKAYDENTTGDDEGYAQTRKNENKEVVDKPSSRIHKCQPPKKPPRLLIISTSSKDSSSESRDSGYSPSLRGATPDMEQDDELHKDQTTKQKPTGSSVNKSPNFSKGSRDTAQTSRHNKTPQNAVKGPSSLQQRRRSGKGQESGVTSATEGQRGKGEVRTSPEGSSGAPRTSRKAAAGGKVPFMGKLFHKTKGEQNKHRGI